MGADLKLAIGADHAGYALKEKLKEKLLSLGYDIDDVGTVSDESVDYPDYAKRVAKKISDSEIEKGILICGSGIGMAIAANRYPNVRAAVANDEESAKLSRQHNDANILSIGSRFVEDEQADKIVDSWLNTEFEGGRHKRRVDKMENL